MAGRWELSDEQWLLVEPVLRGSRRADNRGRPWHDTRAVLNGVLWVLGTGAQWRELPEKYPPFQTCHRHPAVGTQRQTGGGAETAGRTAT
jgi:transposase